MSSYRLVNVNVAAAAAREKRREVKTRQHVTDIPVCRLVAVSSCHPLIIADQWRHTCGIVWTGGIRWVAAAADHWASWWWRTLLRLTRRRSRRQWAWPRRDGGAVWRTEAVLGTTNHIQWHISSCSSSSFTHRQRPQLHCLVTASSVSNSNSQQLIICWTDQVISATLKLMFYRSKHDRSIDFVPVVTSYT